jgi:quinoprotein glucose dehydrogenase
VIDLATGRTIWEPALGTARANGPFGIPSLMPFHIRTPNNGGSVVTRSGLTFVAAATDLQTGMKTPQSDARVACALPSGSQ